MSRQQQHARVAELAPGVIRLLAPNPSLMTGPGTNTYLLGRRQEVVIDPGPALAKHVETIVERCGGRLSAILVTHTHPDHSPAAAQLAAKTGARLIGMPAPEGRHQDDTFVPDAVPRNDELIEYGDVRLRVIHTPGHASNHLCFLREDDGLLFTGDHIINGSTVVIDPPDGSMSDYLESLEHLKSQPLRRIAPGHGDVMEQPTEAIDWIIRHRLQREAKVLAALRLQADCTSADLTRTVYAEVDERLHPVAERSLLAHLLKLLQDGRAEVRDDRWRAAD